MTKSQRVRSFWRHVWTDGDVGRAGELFAPSYVENDVPRTPEGHGSGARQFRGLFPDLSVETVVVWERDDLVVSRVTYRGTYAGGLPGIAPRGQRIEVSGLDVFRFEADLVVEHLHEADHEALWEQLGVSLPPGD